MEHRRQQVVAVRRRFRGHRDEQGVGERRLGYDREVNIGRGDRVTRNEPLAELPADRAGVIVGERLLGDIEPGRVDVVVHVQFLEVHLDRRVANFVDHLNRQTVMNLGIGDGADRQRHRARRGDLRERNDAQKQLLPFHPAFLDLTEHVAANSAVHRAEHAVVFLFLHGEVRAQDLLERIFFRSFLKRVIRRVLLRGSCEGRLPREFLDFLVCLGKALPTHALLGLLGARRSKRRQRWGEPAAAAGLPVGYRYLKLRFVDVRSRLRSLTCVCAGVCGGVCAGVCAGVCRAVGKEPSRAVCAST